MTVSTSHRETEGLLPGFKLRVDKLLSESLDL